MALEKPLLPPTITCTLYPHRPRPQPHASSPSQSATMSPSSIVHTGHSCHTPSSCPWPVTCSFPIPSHMPSPCPRPVMCSIRLRPRALILVPHPLRLQSHAPSLYSSTHPAPSPVSHSTPVPCHMPCSCIRPVTCSIPFPSHALVLVLAHMPSPIPKLYLSPITGVLPNHGFEYHCMGAFSTIAVAQRPWANI